MVDCAGVCRRLLLLLSLISAAAALPGSPYARGFTDAAFNCRAKIHRAEAEDPKWDSKEKVCTRTFDLVLSDEARGKFCAVVDSRFFGTYFADPSGRMTDQFKCIFPKLQQCGKMYVEHRGVCIHVSENPMSLADTSSYCDNVAELKQRSRKFTPLSHRDTEFLARTIRPEVGLVWLDPAKQEQYKLLQNYDHYAEKTGGGHVFNVVSQMVTNDSAHYNYRKPGDMFQVRSDATAHMLCVRQGTQTRKGLERSCNVFYPTVGLPTHYSWGECYYATVNSYAADFRSMRELHSHCKFDYGIRQRAITPDDITKNTVTTEFRYWMEIAYTKLVSKYKYHMSRVHPNANAQFSIDGKDFFGFGMRLPIYNGAVEDEPTFVDHEGTSYPIHMPTINGVDFKDNVKSIQDEALKNGGRTKYDLNAVFYMHVEDASDKRDMTARLDAVVPHRRLPVMCQIKVVDDFSEPNYVYEDCPPGFIEYKTSGVGRTCLMMVTPDPNEIFWKKNHFCDHTSITTKIANELEIGNRAMVDKMRTVYEAYEKFCNNYEDSRYPGRKVRASLARFANKKDVADSLSIFSGSADIGTTYATAALVAGFSSTNKGGGTDTAKESFAYTTPFMGQSAPPKDAWDPNDGNGNEEPNNAKEARPGSEQCVQLLSSGLLNDIACNSPKKFLCRIHEPLKEEEIY